MKRYIRRRVLMVRRGTVGLLGGLLVFGLPLATNATSGDSMQVVNNVGYTVQWGYCPYECSKWREKYPCLALFQYIDYEGRGTVDLTKTTPEKQCVKIYYATVGNESHWTNHSCRAKYTRDNSAGKTVRFKNC